MDNIAIEVKNVSKKFDIYKDKASSLKEKVIFWNRNKKNIRWVLNDIDLTINKGEAVALIRI